MNLEKVFWRRYLTLVKQKILGTDVVVVSFGDVSENMLLKLGLYGASKIISVPSVYKADGQVVTKLFQIFHKIPQSLFFFQELILNDTPRLSISLKTLIFQM